MIAAIALLGARILMAALFIESALSKLRDEPEEVRQVRSLRLPAPAVLLRLSGVCEVVGAGMLVSGLLARIAAVMLCAFVLGITFAFQMFWTNAESREIRTQQMNTFFSNLAIAGGLICVAAQGPGTLAFSLS